MKTTPFPAKFQCHLVAAIGINSELLGAPLSRLFGVIPAAAALQRLPRRRAKLIEHRIFGYELLSGLSPPIFLLDWASSLRSLLGSELIPERQRRRVGLCCRLAPVAGTLICQWETAPGELIEPPQLLLSSSELSMLCIISNNG